MPEINVIAVFKESFTLVILLFCSIIVLTFAIERWWFLSNARINTECFMA